jgi:DNA-binding response OmpR family regulator
MAATTAATPAVYIQPTRNGRTAAKLTRKESQLLEMLIRNAGRAVSRETLLTQVWGYGEGLKSRTVDVHIQRLRRKLPPETANSIKTIVRDGYCWLPEPARASGPAAS